MRGPEDRRRARLRSAGGYWPNVSNPLTKVPNCGIVILPSFAIASIIFPCIPRSRP